jgi:hypothetical protein
MIVFKKPMPNALGRRPIVNGVRPAKTIMIVWLPQQTEVTHSHTIIQSSPEGNSLVVTEAPLSSLLVLPRWHQRGSSLCRGQAPCCMMDSTSTVLFPLGFGALHAWFLLLCTVTQSPHVSRSGNCSGKMVLLVHELPATLEAGGGGSKVQKSRVAFCRSLAFAVICAGQYVRSMIQLASSLDGGPPGPWSWHDHGSRSGIRVWGLRPSFNGLQRRSRCAPVRHTPFLMPILPNPPSRPEPRNVTIRSARFPRLGALSVHEWPRWPSDGAETAVGVLAAYVGRACPPAEAHCGRAPELAREREGQQRAWEAGMTGQVVCT